MQIKIGDVVSPISSKKFNTNLYQSYKGKKGVITEIYSENMFDVTFLDNETLLYYPNEVEKVND